MRRDENVLNVECFLLLNSQENGSELSEEASINKSRTKNNFCIVENCLKMNHEHIATTAGSPSKTNELETNC